MNTTNIVPKVLHFIWLGETVSSSAQSNIDAFTKMNPDFEVRLWRDNDLLWLENREIFLDAPTYSGKKDIARYEIVAKHGGYYLDCDFECVAPMTPICRLAESGQVVVSKENQYFYCNAFFGAVPEHPLIVSLVRDLPDRYWGNPGSSPQFSSGPTFLTRQVKKYIANGEPGVIEVPRDWVFPYSFDKLERASGPWSDEVVMAHHWDGARTDLSGPRRFFNAKWLKGVMAQILFWIKRGRVQGEARELQNRVPTVMRLSDSSSLTIDKWGNPLVFLHDDLEATATLYIDGVYDNSFHLFLKRVLSGSDNYVDVGANIGQFVITAGQVLSDYGRIFAIEPNPEVARILEQNVYLSRSRGQIKCEVSVLRIACGSNSDTVNLHVPSLHAGRGTLIPAALGDVSLNLVESILVEKRTLDSVVGHLSHVRLLKIDVEGSEAEVLDGAARLIRDGRVDYIDLEFAPSHLGGSLQRVLDWIGGQVDSGANVWEITKTGRLRRILFSEFKNEPRHLSHLIIQSRRVRDEIL